MTRQNTAPPEVRGTIPPAFEPVAQTMQRLVEDGTEVGLSVAATRDGDLVLDASCGSTGTGSPWTNDTLAIVFSCTKGAAAMCAQILYDRGLLDVDAPVTRYWPEFAAAGKGDTLVSHLLSHTAGVFTYPNYWQDIGVDSLGVDDWEAMVTGLAASPSTWPSGSEGGYHSVSYGFLVGEVLRRIDGRTLGQFFADEIAKPLGLDFWIGLPESEDHRYDPVLPQRPAAQPAAPSEEARTFAEFMKQAVDTARVQIRAGQATDREALPISSLFMHPDYPTPNTFLPEVYNHPRVRRCELPNGNGVGNALALAKMYAAMACGGEIDGVRLFSRESTRRFTTIESTLNNIGTYGLGYLRWQLTTPAEGTGENAFGHSGAGGSAAFADLDRGISFAVVKNQMTMDGGRTAAELARALYRCLDSTAEATKAC